MNKEVLRLEAAQYRELAAQIKQSYADIDDETLHDTLEGLSNLPDIIESIVRSSLEDDVLIVGLKSRLEDMSARLTRFRLRYEKKRPDLKFSHIDYGAIALRREVIAAGP